MTKKLEQLFDLASLETNDLNEPLPEQTIEVTETALDNLEKIENALPQVRGLEMADVELDELASLATASYKDLIDLGMQVEAKYSNEIFSSASTFLGHAITAKTAKVHKKLRMIELQLKKATLDQKQNKKEEEIDNTPLGTATALDRNEILKMMLDKKKEQ